MLTQVGDVEEKLSYVGSLEAKASVTVAAKIAGRAERLFVDVGDWKDLAEYPVETKVPLFLQSLILLDKLLKGLELDVQQVGHRHDRRQFGEVHQGPVRVPSLQTSSPLIKPDQKKRPVK